MANPQYINLLLQDVGRWNAWREQPLDIRPDLSDAELINADLRKADLFSVNLARANLEYADLSDANLSHANLHSAIIRYTTLRFTDFSEANLSHARLREADFSHANLTGANMANATIAGTTFADVDFRSVQGLETVAHHGPSTIGIDTLFRSEGQIPESFLRQAGVPEEFITYLPSLVSRAIEYYTCFISYTKEDEDFAKRLYADLQASGVRCWFAPEHLKIGDKYQDRIFESIRLYDKLLLLLSEASVTSDWVQAEVEAALSKEAQKKREVLFPVRLDDAVMQSTSGWADSIRQTRLSETLHAGKTTTPISKPSSDSCATCNRSDHNHSERGKADNIGCYKTTRIGYGRPLAGAPALRPPLLASCPLSSCPQSRTDV